MAAADRAIFLEMRVLRVCMSMSFGRWRVAAALSSSAIKAWKRAAPGMRAVWTCDRRLGSARGVRKPLRLRGQAAVRERPGREAQLLPEGRRPRQLDRPDLEGRIGLQPVVGLDQGVHV